MTATAVKEPTTTTATPVALGGIPGGALAARDQRPGVHPAELHPLRRATTPSWHRRPARTKKIWDTLTRLFVEERKKGVLDISQVPSSITAHAPGYIDKDNEVIVGLQTEAPLKRAIMPNGGFRMVLGALKTYGYEPDPHVVEAFTKYRKTHNDGVFDAYTADIRRCRSSHILTGLPDAYGRGPHHRGLPPGGALRRGPADRAQEGGEGWRSTPSPPPRTSSGTGRSCRSRPGAGGTQEDGRELRLRHLGPRPHAPARRCSGSTSATWRR